MKVFIGTLGINTLTRRIDSYTSSEHSGVLLDDLDSSIFVATSDTTSLVRNSPAIKAEPINIVKTALQLFAEMYPVNKGPIAAPIEPVPSIIAVTVARAREFPFNDLCVPKSAETAVVIRAYGPFTNIPVTNINTPFTSNEMCP
jgi:hypothetical protein